MVYYRILNIVPCASRTLMFTYFVYNSSSPTPPPFGNYKFVFCVCESVSQIRKKLIYITYGHRR